MSGYEPIAPLPVEGPRVSLLTAARRLPDSLNWSTGISARQVGCPTSSRWPFCPDVDDEKADAVGQEPASFLPFTVYVTTLCDEPIPALTSEQRQITEQQAEASTAWHVARELWTGAFSTAGRANPSLQAPFPGEVSEFPVARIVASVGAALSPVDGLGALFAAYEDGLAAEEGNHHGGGAVVHVPSRVVPYLMSSGVIAQQGDRYVGPGFGVSPGPGYPTRPGSFGPKVAADTDGLPQAAGEVWAYITGPVDYGTGPIRTLPEAGSAGFDRRMNRYELWGERQAIVRFEPCNVWAVLLDLVTTV